MGDWETQREIQETDEKIMTDQDHIAALKAAADLQRVAASLGLRGRGKRFFCPLCQPNGGKTPDLVIEDKGFFCHIEARKRQGTAGGRISAQQGVGYGVSSGCCMKSRNYANVILPVNR